MLGSSDMRTRVRSGKNGRCTEDENGVEECQQRVPLNHRRLFPGSPSLP